MEKKTLDTAIVVAIVTGVFGIVVALINIIPSLSNRPLPQESTTQTPTQSTISKPEVSTTQTPTQTTISKPVDFTVQTPVLDFLVMQRQSKKSPWQDVKFLVSRQRYKISLRVFQRAYIYGFQKDSSGKIQSLYPVPEPDMPQKYQYSLPNPVEPGEYDIPPQEIICALDNIAGQECFYFFYSKTAIEKPKQILERYLIDPNSYSQIVLKTLEHREATSERKTK